MQREFRIITELSRNNLKVPKPILLCVDKSISEDDFYIMEYIEGETIADNLIAENYSDSQKKKITESFISTLAELHTFDVLGSNLKDLGKNNKSYNKKILEVSNEELEKHKSFLKSDLRKNFY